MKSRDFFDSLAHKWDAAVADGRAQAEKAIARAVNALALRDGATVLDVGCGTGRAVPYIVDALGDTGRIIGTDFAYQMLVEANTKRLAPHLVYVQADAQQFPVRSASVDAIMCFAAFAHFSRKRAFLEEAYRVLRSGSKMAICHPMSSRELNEFHKKVGKAVGDHMLPNPAHVAAMARKIGFGVEEAIDEAGFNLVVLRKRP